MAAAEVLAVGNTAATSDEIAVATDIVFALKGVTGPQAYVWVEVKDDAGAWQPASQHDVLTPDRPVWIARDCPSAIRFRREAGGMCGVFRAD
jgi:hypothetical protein